MESILYNLSEEQWSPIYGTISTGIYTIINSDVLPFPAKHAFVLVDRELWCSKVLEACLDLFTRLSEADIQIHLIFIRQAFAIEDLPKLASVGTIVGFDSQSFNRYIRRLVERKGNQYDYLSKAEKTPRQTSSAKRKRYAVA